MTTRTTRIYRIAELMLRFKAESFSTGLKPTWRVLDTELHAHTPATYHDEATAVAGARMSAAVEIDALYDEVMAG